MNLTRKRLEAIKTTLDILLADCDDDTLTIGSNAGSVMVADAREAREWASERIEKLDAGKWY